MFIDALQSIAPHRVKQDIERNNYNTADYFNEQLPPDQSESSWAGLDQ